MQSNKKKSGTQTEEETVTTSADLVEAEETIEACDSCVSDIDAALDESTSEDNFDEDEWDVADRAYDKIMESKPDPASFESSTDYFRASIAWKSSPEISAKLEEHRAKYPDYWACVCG